jgi:hypothetical protein
LEFVSFLALKYLLELARQAFEIIQDSYPGYTVEIEQGSAFASGKADV